ncbi:hypothetical protein ACCO45_010375 [Purpureocillium lilacinum]|uniref:Uncharacterized protein n=1 Tax=Purpureocillium lilacinum TaxID=33203 RepID=A0ACC4DG37_PURLI
MPSAQAQRRSPKPAILRANLSSSSADKHMRLFSSAQLSAQLSQHLAQSQRPSQPPALLHPFRLEEDVGDGGNSTAKALSPLQLAGAAVIIASKDIHTQGDHLVIYASSSTQRSGQPPLARWQRRHGGDYHLRLLLDGHALLIFAAVGIPPTGSSFTLCAG